MLAIVIPYFKHTFFEETLLSLANQTNKQFKVYIGNDASPENPSLLLEQYKDKFDFVYYEFESNLGGISLVQQWNRCIAKVEDEEWLMILGDDDVLSENVVEEFYKNRNEIQSLDSHVIRYASVVIDAMGKEISKTYTHPKLETATDFLMRKIKGGTRSSLSEYIFKKPTFDEVGFKDFPLAWSSDVLAVVEVSVYNNIFTINNATVSFRQSGLNISSQQDSIEKNNAWFKFYTYLLANYGKKYPKELVDLLFDRLEKVQLNNKKAFLRWFELFGLYSSFSKYSRFLSLFVKIKNSVQ